MCQEIFLCEGKRAQVLKRKLFLLLHKGKCETINFEDPYKMRLG